ncbi:MAG: class II fructose-bisphosphate aldolase [bacterium]|nr:class II fructose-bisphosphate aldolase [bacterium]
MKTLAEYQKIAREEGWALPHFNISSLDQLWGIALAAREAQSPVLVGTSEGEREYLGMRQVVALIRSLREEGVPLFLNADHCKSAESAIKALEAGYDSVHIDLSKESYEVNMRGTQQVVVAAKKKSPEVQVEGELGYLATDSSMVYEKEIAIPEDSYTNVEQAVEFVEKTGVHRLAPAVGTIHGIAVNKPRIRFDLISQLNAVVGDRVALVLHGGSGTQDKDLVQAIQEGISNVHISTELRVAYREALDASLQNSPKELAPYRYLMPARVAVQQAVAKKIALFGVQGKQ